MSKLNPNLILTPRRKEILTLIAEGYTYKEIGRKLVISMKTVSSALEKTRIILDARNTTHAVAIALSTNEIKINMDEEK